MALNFTHPEISLLIGLLIAYIIVEFGIRTDLLSEQKQKKGFKSWFLYLHGIAMGLAVFVVLGFSIPIWLPVAVACVHIVADLIQIRASNTARLKTFVCVQLVNVLTLLSVWFIYTDKTCILSDLVFSSLNNYKLLVLMLAYLWVILPASYIIKLAVSGLISNKKIEPKGNDEENGIEHAGKYIGVFERIIILTLVLLGQYEAIGFLITGKSIIRMVSTEKTEYVLAGTLMSYAIAITIGVLANFLLHLNI